MLLFNDAFDFSSNSTLFDLLWIVVDLLYNVLRNESTAYRTSGVELDSLHCVSKKFPP